MNMWIGFTLLTVSMLLYIATLGFILPRLLLRAKYVPVTLSARGIRRCYVNGKRCVVYERKHKCRKYITHYLIHESDKCKLLKCKVTPAVRQLTYDVICFDRYKKPFDVIHVKETLGSSYTKLLALPRETSYAEIRLRRVNNKKHSSARVARHSARHIILFAICAIALTLIEALAVMAGVSYAFGGVFRENLMLHFDLRLLIATVVSTVFGLFVTWIATLRTAKGKRKDTDEGFDK